MELQKYTAEELPDLLKYQILSFMRTEWPEGFIGRWRGRRWINLPEFNPLHFVLMDQDFVVAHAVRLWRDWQHKEISYRVYGISGVFVFPDYQGEGHGKRLIQAITDDCMNQPDSEVGMLWCAPQLQGFYAKCGWEPMRSTVTLLGDDIDDVEEHHEEILFMRFFSDSARSRRDKFEGESLYFGWTTW